MNTFTHWPIIGHDWAVDLLRRAVAAGRPPHALLVTGPPNVGKGTLVRTFAQALLCTGENPPCQVCRACQLAKANTHPDLLWIEPQSGSLKVDQVRGLTHQLALAPVEGPWQIAVLDQFESATAGAANALLKTLEEPPSTVVLALLAQQAEALLPTIVSRCQVMPLRLVPQAMIEKALIQQWQTESDQAHLLSHICGGRIGWAISATNHPLLLKEREQRLNELVSLLQSNRVARFAYAETLSRKSSTVIQETLELWTGWWRDVLLLSSHTSVTLTNIDRRQDLLQITASCNVNIARQVLSALRNTLDHLSRNVNTRLALEVLLLDLPFLTDL